MRWLILGIALSAVAAPAPAAEFMLSSTEVKSGSPMALAQALTACKGAKHLAGALLVGQAERHRTNSRILITAAWSHRPPCRPRGCRTASTPAARANRGRWSGRL